MKEYTIEKLAKLMIETDFKEKKLKKKIYVRKIDAYKDLIKLLKEVKDIW